VSIIATGEGALHVSALDSSAGGSSDCSYTNEIDRRAAKPGAFNSGKVTMGGAGMYLRPRTLDEALAALAHSGGRILAGGTDFYPSLGDRPVAGPVVDISAVAELTGIDIGEDRVRIGGRVTWSEIANAELPPCFTALQQAAREVGSVQIQNVGTIAGNLCNASPAADGVPPLLACDAAIEIADRSGTRSVPLAQFLAGYRRTIIRPHEIVTAVTLPIWRRGHSSFHKLGLRRYLVISIAMVTVLLEADESGCVARAGIAVGGCSAVALRLRPLEAALVGAPVQPGLGERVDDEHVAVLTPIDDVRASSNYRRRAALILLQRAIEDCVVRHGQCLIP
jgi:CO/xanthine dehydrogenase FAD-binding subunit